MSSTDSSSASMSLSPSNGPSTTGSIGPSGSNFFSSSGTPALILAFLAIGLFIGGMVAMFGMRRRMIARRLARRFADRTPGEWTLAEFDERRGSRRRRRPVGRRPVLWDMYAERKGAVDSSWAKIVPISGRVMAEDPPPQASNIAPAHSSGPCPSPLHSFFAQSRRGFRAGSPAAGPAPTHNDSPAAYLEVAVAIAMPAPPPASKSQIPDLSIGLVEVPWAGDSAADAAFDSVPSLAGWEVPGVVLET